MSDERAKAGEDQPPAKGSGFFGSLKDALVAASRDDLTAAKPAQLPAVLGAAPSAPAVAGSDAKPADPVARPAPSAAEAARVADVAET